MAKRFQFRLRTLLWIVFAVAVLMVPVRQVVILCLDIQYVYTVEIPTLKKEGKPLPGEPGYVPSAGRRAIGRR